MLEEMRKDKGSVTPKTGYNVVGVDDFEPPGDQLYIIGHYESREEAEAALARWKESHEDPAYVYGPETK